MGVNKALQQALEQLPPAIKQLYVAFSGGLDSTVLLHALSAQSIIPELTLKPLHVHHGLSPHADRWVNHCRQFTEALSLSLEVVYVNAKPHGGESPEAAARRARYDAFSKYIKSDIAFVLAHHANDQAETLLLQLLRGSGLRGLASMPALAQFQSGWLVRPFLQITRKELEQYAHQHQLTWVDDESNLSFEFDRNYLRHQVMPLLEARWPATVTCLSRSARHCAEAEELLLEIAATDMAKAMHEETSILNIESLTTLSTARLNNVLRYWLTVCGLPLPSTVKLQTIVKTVINSRYDTMPCVTWPGAEVRRFRHQLYAMLPLVPHDPSWRYEWDVTQDLDLPAKLGILRAADYQKLADGQLLTVTFRHGSETIRLIGRQYHHSLKNLMQEWGIPPWQRQRIPLIFKNNELVAIPGFVNP
jgi:tRNA(Ile)-lysidine synthase